MSSSPSEPLRDIFDARGRGLQHHGLRRANERAVLTVIAFNPGVSNAEIARLSGLAPQTVSAILGDIDRQGLITRGEVLRGRRGQPATPIFLRADGAYAIGIEIGWRHLDMILLDLGGQVLARRQRDYQFPDAATIVTEVADLVAELRLAVPEGSQARLADLGIALPTNIAANLDLVDAPDPQGALWARLDLAEELGRRTGLEVSLVNDGNAACWAELIAFPRPRPGNFIYFMISRYIAAGIVGEGMLWEGPTGNSANLGAMLVGDREGEGRPAHFVASLTALAGRLAAAGVSIDETRPRGWDWTAFGPVLDEWIADSARTLARVVFNTTAVIESSLVVVDGIMPPTVIERLVDRVGMEMRNLPVTGYQPPQVLPGHLGALAPALGAAQLTLYRRYFSRTFADVAG